MARQLNQLMETRDANTMTGRDLRDLVLKVRNNPCARMRACQPRMHANHASHAPLFLPMQKWGRSYDVILRKVGNRVHLPDMWKFLEQQSFPLTEKEFMEQLDAVAAYVTEWGVVDVVKRGIMAAHPKGPGMTGRGCLEAIRGGLPADPCRPSPSLPFPHPHALIHRLLILAALQVGELPSASRSHWTSISQGPGRESGHERLSHRANSSCRA